MKKHTNEENNKNYTNIEFIFDVKIKNQSVISLNAKYINLNNKKRDNDFDDFF